MTYSPPFCSLSFSQEIEFSHSHQNAVTVSGKICLEATSQVSPAFLDSVFYSGYKPGTIALSWVPLLKFLAMEYQGPP